MSSPYIAQVYEQTEADLVAQLSTDLGTVANIKPLPETEKGFADPTTKPNVYIGYVGSKFQEKTASNGLNGTETMYFNVIIRSKKLRLALGIYDTLAFIRSSLLGFKPSMTSYVYFEDVELFELVPEGNFYTYTARVCCDTQFVSDQHVDEAVLADRITRININDAISGDSYIDDTGIHEN